MLDLIIAFGIVSLCFLFTFALYAVGWTFKYVARKVYRLYLRKQNKVIDRVKPYKVYNVYYR